MVAAQPLFFEPVVYFEKSAGGEVVLPEDPNEWPNELMQELYKQVPYVADFEPNVTMDRVDAERGFGFGHIEVQNKTEVQHGAPPDAMQAAGIKSARIPIVIKDRKLQPLDLVVTTDSKILPLTESRLRQVIFRPQVFDITGRGPGDMSMIGQLYPPYRQNYGFGGGGATMNVGMGKEGSEKVALGKMLGELVKKAPADRLGNISRLATSRGAQMVGQGGQAAAKGQKYLTVGTAAAQRLAKTGSVLEAILPTINQSHLDALCEKVSSDRGLQAQLVKNGFATRPSLELLGKYEPVDSKKYAGAVFDRVTPSVVQLKKEGEGYSLKTASHAAWGPDTRVLDRGEAVRLLGSKVVLAADESGSATMTAQQGVAEEPEEDVPELISQFGIYKVQDEQGKQLIGYVFPNLIDLDGQALPICLFTNGSQMAVQGEIAGVNVGGGASLFEGPPRGKGVFYEILSNGRAQATIPMTVQATMSSPEQGGVVLHAETFDGRQVQVSVQPNIQAITPEGDHLLIPDHFSWLPLDEAEETALVSDPQAFNKEAQAKLALASVLLRSDGAGSFSVDGFPVEKLGSDEKHFISLDDTLFLLGGLGTDLNYAQQKIGQASAWSRPIQVRVGHHIKTAEDRYRKAVGQASETLARVREVMPARQDLLKEAAVIPDPVAVDTVLSLGFINPENLGMFISYMPTIDEAQMKMCELLLAARLGLRDIPVPALEKAIRSTEEVLEGLKILAFEKS